MRKANRAAAFRPLLLVLLLSVLSVFAAARSAAAPVPADTNDPARCAAAIVSQLSGQPGFSAWKTGLPRIEALGPGTHGWLATVVGPKGTPLGYAVVYAAEDGSCRLGEYGLGPKPLFDTTTLRIALATGGYIPTATSNAFRAVKHYIHPFAAAWEVKLAKKTIWLDAKTAELLPVDNESQWLAAAAGEPYMPADAGAAPDKPRELRLLTAAETFDPYERLSWLLGDKPFAPQPDRLIARLKAKNRLVYVAEPLGDKMLYAQSVVGYQRWQGGRLDLALDMNGSRFIPLDALVKLSDGLFYR
ncbi:hypothetical protein SAMN05216312_107296 [Cohnella sp. OV330]|uniref:hypothetical protein n=1 Tax=Cohnella sp. OV330 TaxID=1855288 RepID=UPI0008EFED5C|nr:hypothetical protein [Cohnella sp. OV330]SFB41970.1 hypothetical protein SAMN05216312_107296 [Cohnella sp. OV330]